MNSIEPKPYSTIEDKTYPFNGKIIIKASDFTNLPFEDGKSTFTFVNCTFRKLEIENNETIDFNNINILFINCFIEDINIENFVTTNFSIHFSNSILKGKINNTNLLSVEVNNCLLTNYLFLIDLKRVQVSFTEDNVFPIKWRKLFESSNTRFKKLLEEQHLYHISACKDIVFTINEVSKEKTGYYEISYPNTIEEKQGYYLTVREKKKFKINLTIQYSAEKEHNTTQISNAKLSQLHISGYSTGKVSIEHTKIDKWFLRNFSTQLGSTFYDIETFRKAKDTVLEIHKSNLDKVWFDNVSFDDYSTICFYRNNFGLTNFTTCDFPNEYKDFNKIQTVENIHYSNFKDKNYHKIRYETFLQFKKQLEASGNFYEAQKFQAVSNDALKSIKGLSFWDKIILQINCLSNNHGLSIKQPFIWTLISSVVFYILYLLSLGRIFNSNYIDWNLVGYYFSFFDITHRNDFLVNKSELNGWSITIDSFHKLIVGFLIYQFIAAFRKYGKK